MKSLRFPSSAAFQVAAVAGALSVALSAHSQSASAINVQYSAPEQFTEIRNNPTVRDNVDPAWLTDLKRYVETRAGKNLAEGQHLDVTITDIRRAGDFEPWRGPFAQDVRVVRDIYPPRIDLDFKLTDAQGNVIKTGKRELRDPAFMSRMTLHRDDPLRYEKALVDDWLHKELKTAS